MNGVSKVSLTVIVTFERFEMEVSSSGLSAVCFIQFVEREGRGYDDNKIAKRRG